MRETAFRGVNRISRRDLLAPRANQLSHGTDLQLFWAEDCFDQT
jgi:hypothetical protein